MASPSLPPLPRTIFEGDLTLEERQVLKARYRHILRKVKRNDELTDVERALQALLVLFVVQHVVTIENLEALVDAEFDESEEDRGGPEHVQDEEAEEEFESAILERIRARGKVREAYELAYRILMNPTRRTN